MRPFVRWIERGGSSFSGGEVVVGVWEREGRGGRRVFSQRRSRSQDSRAVDWAVESLGRASARVEILCWWISYAYTLLPLFEGRVGTYGINVTMRPLHFLKRLHPVISMQIQQKALEVRHFAVPRDMNPSQTINGFHALDHAA